MACWVCLGRDPVSALGWLRCRRCAVAVAHRRCLMLPERCFLSGAISGCLPCALGSGDGDRTAAQQERCAQLYHASLRAEARSEATGTTANQLSHLTTYLTFATNTLGFQAHVALPDEGPMPDGAVRLWLMAEASRVSGGTWEQYLATLNAWHKQRGLPLPSVAMTRFVKGARKHIGERPTPATGVGAQVVKKAEALSIDALRALLMQCDRDALAATTRAERYLARRDAAILTLGFFGLLRKSELTAADLAHLSRVESSGKAPAHWRLSVPKAKNDQTRRGRAPLLADLTASRVSIHSILSAYLALREPYGGQPLFLNVAWGKVLDKRLASDGQIISTMLQRRMRRLPGHFQGFTSHSLRRGGLNQARKSGVGREERQLLAGWKAEASQDDYIQFDLMERVDFIQRM
jgi:integrase